MFQESLDLLETNFTPLPVEYQGFFGVLRLLKVRTNLLKKKKEFSEHGKTVGLLLRLTKPIWGTGRVVVLDSGFCVVKGIIALKKKGHFLSGTDKKEEILAKIY